MKKRILTDPAFGPGLIVWAVAVSVLPLRLGLSGAGFAGFVAYVALAGVLLAVADAVLNPVSYRHLSDVAQQGLFWAIGISVPSLLAFSLGTALAPVHSTLSDNLCVIGGIEGSADHDDRTDSAFEDALEALDDCDPPPR